MSRQRELDLRLRSLHDIGDVLSAMKNLSIVEIHRLEQFLAAQQRVVHSMEAAAADLAQFHPHLFAAPDQGSPRVCLLIGSERGFCGDLNPSLLRAFLAANGKLWSGDSKDVVVVGSKLSSNLPPELQGASVVNGPSVAEEIDTAVTRLAECISAHPRAFEVAVFHHDPQKEGVQTTRLHPTLTAHRPPGDPPPHLYLDPPTVAKGLLEHYLLARLHQLLYISLMAENHARIAHIESAARRLERKSEDLVRRRNRLRQEEITEEIEVILLSVDAT